MDKPNAEDVMKEAGITKNWDALRSGKIALTLDEAQKLRRFEEGYFRNSAKNWIGAEKWNKMNPAAQDALYDMAQNMGGRFTGKHQTNNKGIKGQFLWKDLRQAILSNNIVGIGDAIRKSEYIKQVGNLRAGSNIVALQEMNAAPKQYAGANLLPVSGDAIWKPPAINVLNSTTEENNTNIMAGKTSPLDNEYSFGVRGPGGTFFSSKLFADNG
jgi:hypothetical protein